MLTLSADVEDIGGIVPNIGRYRDLLVRGWSPQTAYPGFVQPGVWATGDPKGQCGVSSVWLAHRLQEDFGISATFCRGAFRFNAQRAKEILDHCWLEVRAGSGDTLVLDLTCDQASGFDQPYVFESVTELENKDIRYIAQDRLVVSELPNSILERYKVLVLNLAGVVDGCKDGTGGDED
jgi:hypothetical protein